MSRYEKSEKRFNFIDVLIILSVLLILAASLFRAQIITFLSDGEHRKACVIHFQSEEISEENLIYIKDGTEFSWLEREQKLGVLSGKPAVTPATLYIQKDDGTYDKVADPSNAIISGTIKANVLYDEETGCFIGGTSFIAPGMVITVHSKDIQFKLTVTEIEF